MIEFLRKTKKPVKTTHPSKMIWPTHVEALTKGTFDQFISTYPLSMIDFWAPWCAPCKTMLPRLRRLERIYQKKVAFARVNTSEEKAIAKQYKIMGIPHFGFFRYGKHIGSVTGVKSVGEMKKIVDSYLSKYEDKYHIYE